MASHETADAVLLQVSARFQVRVHINGRSIRQSALRQHLRDFHAKCVKFSLSLTAGLHLSLEFPTKTASAQVMLILFPIPVGIGSGSC